MTLTALAAKQEVLRLLEQKAAIVKHNRLRYIFPDDGPRARHLYPKHVEFMRLGATTSVRAFMAANQIGKALRNGEPVATPNGWAAIESLRVGDAVIAGDGTPTEVVGVFPQGVKQLYRIHFEGGNTIDCCGEHLWVYKHPRARYQKTGGGKDRKANPFFGEWSTASTETILAEVGETPTPIGRVVFPTSAPWQIPSQSVPFDAYAMGLLLGDGSMRNNGFRYASADKELTDALSLALPSDCALVCDGGYNFRVTRGTKVRDIGLDGRFVRSSPVINTMRALGCWDLLAHEKSIPDVYLRNSIGVRLAMLQGLMDADGSISKSGAMEFSSTSLQLAHDVAYLVHSLGGWSTIEQRQTHYTHKGEKKPGRISYRVRIRLGICPFRLARKVSRWNPRRNTLDRVVHRIEKIDMGEATCITVAHPSHTFVTAHGVVTHNSTTGCVELTYHLTGLYPEWWEGKRFTKPIRAWAASETHQTVRDNLQRHLIGDMDDGYGTGFIPREMMGHIATKAAPYGAVDYVKIKHVSGGWSNLVFKSYDMRRPRFQSDQIEVVLLDEEPDDMGIYTECVTRTTTTGGIVMLTFTSLKGITPLVIRFMPEFAGADLDVVKDDGSSRAVVVCGWDDVPHIDEATKTRLKAEYSPHELQARTTGIPNVGAGQIYPVPESDFVIDPFPLPDYWPRFAALDPGTNRTAALWFAWDQTSDVLYVYSEHYRGVAEIEVHAAAMKARGLWIPFVSDDSTDVEGNTTVGKYAKQGLLIRKAQKSDKDARIMEMYSRLSSGRMKVFRGSCPNFLFEYRLYRRNENGKIVSEHDHLMNCGEYGCQSGIKVARLKRPDDIMPKVQELTFGLH